MFTTVWIVVGFTLWFLFGWASRCLKFGTWVKNPIVRLAYDGNRGSWYLSWELFVALCSGPIVGLQQLWLCWKDGVAIGFKRPTNVAFLKFLGDY